MAEAHFYCAKTKLPDTGGKIAGPPIDASLALLDGLLLLLVGFHDWYFNSLAATAATQPQVQADLSAALSGLLARSRRAASWRSFPYTARNPADIPHFGDSQTLSTQTLLACPYPLSPQHGTVGASVNAASATPPR